MVTSVTPGILNDSPVLPRCELSASNRHEMKPGMAASIEAFRAALPQLLEMRSEPIQWVAFASDKMVGIGRTQTELYQQCLASGLKRGDFVVRLITPESNEELELPNEL